MGSRREPAYVLEVKTIDHGVSCALDVHQVHTIRRPDLALSRPPAHELSPEIRAELGARIRAVVQRFPGQAEAAEVASISTQSLHNLMTGKSLPSLIPLSRLAAAAGIRLEWIATGDPPMLAPNKGGRPPLDRELLARIFDALARVYREEKVNLPDVELGRLAGDEYDAIVASTEDADERMTMVKLVAEKHRRALRTEHPASRKRGA
jgi:DNA-binding phage protein